MDVINKFQKIGKNLDRKRFVDATGGNLSYRDHGHIFITASGSNLGNLEKKDILMIPLDKEALQLKQRGGGGRSPSSELPLHYNIYKKTKAKAIIHCHPIYPILISNHTNENTLKCNTESSKIIIGEQIKIIERIQPGTKKLAKKTSKQLKKEKGLILKNHGVVSKGQNFDQAMNTIEAINQVSKNTYLSLILNS
ncbi:MAG: Ribulose-5-phosphate 4-epimerase/Fuculose-1-phosphate aldolase AraD [Candidatus Methanohalarchaeum thermophilum]|uniref:Ribulose-5-phosphate 4-epimerase/Fuculose-1-phosphate aldolase AraD n=1 Tax=Methanohalarchaeum thermophilum TaxID=1903181 RepID=A0A1Q6DTK6_METT1|nr:MAG: Ribulose-5-phosphate 4-epimerase/Fuculose-1-phosphate aldolase AraD [Candidatus Methanohalarchaeum thermophilum]